MANHPSYRSPGWMALRSALPSCTLCIRGRRNWSEWSPPRKCDHWRTSSWPVRIILCISDWPWLSACRWTTRTSPRRTGGASPSKFRGELICAQDHDRIARDGWSYCSRWPWLAYAAPRRLHRRWLPPTRRVCGTWYRENIAIRGRTQSRRRQRPMCNELSGWLRRNR